MRRLAESLPWSTVDFGRVVLAGLGVWILIQTWQLWINPVASAVLRWGTATASEGIGQVLIANTLRATAGVIGAVLGLLIVLILAAFLIIDAERIGRGVAVLLPVHHRARAAALTESALSVMGAYVRGQPAVSLAVGAMIVVGVAVKSQQIVLGDDPGDWRFALRPLWRRCQL